MFKTTWREKIIGTAILTTASDARVHDVGTLSAKFARVGGMQALARAKIDGVRGM